MAPRSAMNAEQGGKAGSRAFKEHGPGSRSETRKQEGNAAGIANQSAAGCNVSSRWICPPVGSALCSCRGSGDRADPCRWLPSAAALRLACLLDAAEVATGALPLFRRDSHSGPGWRAHGAALTLLENACLLLQTLKLAPSLSFQRVRA